MNNNLLFEFNLTNSIETITIDYDAPYKIECWGASGGGKDKYTCGLGAYSTTIVDLKKGDVLKILVAGKGAWDGYRGGGGGGSFVELQAGASATAATLLCAAGGGGGSMFSRTPNNYSHGQSCKYGGNYALNGFKTNEKYGGNAYAGGGGAGYINNGGSMTCTPSSHAFAWIYGGASFKNGGTGGYGTLSYNAGGYTVDMSPSPKGGFGGGGAGSFYRSVGWMNEREGFYFNGAGGGGGYTGGDSTRDGYANTGGGGGSYFYNNNETYDKYTYALNGYDKMLSPTGRIVYGNYGDGFVRISCLKLSYYAVLKDDKYYIPTNKFVSNGKLTPVTLDFLKSKNNLKSFIYDINIIKNDGKKYIDLSNAKIVKFIKEYSDKYTDLLRTIVKNAKTNLCKNDILFNYDPIKKHLLEGSILINITNNTDLDFNIIKNTNNNIKVGILNNKYIYGKNMCKISKDEIIDKGIDIKDLKNYIIPFDNYKLIMCFTDSTERLSKIIQTGFNYYKYKTITDKNINITTDYKNIYIFSDENLNKMLINKLYNNIDQSTLEEVY